MAIVYKMNRIPLPEEIAAIDYLASLIDKGEKLLEVSKHPGKTRELHEWITSMQTYVSGRYGESSHMWKRAESIRCFPRWFDNDIHGTGPESVNPNAPTGFALTEEQEKERRQALACYKEGIEHFIALLKSMKEDVEVNGLPSKSKSSTPFIQTTFAPTFSQSQNQSQQQKIDIQQQIQGLLSMVEEKYGEEKAQEAKILLSELEKNHGKWSTVEKVTKFFLQLGRDSFVSLLPLLVQILLKLPQGS